MSDEVTRQMREEREEARVNELMEKAKTMLTYSTIPRKQPVNAELTLTERIDEHCRIVAMAEESVKSPVSIGFDPQLAIDEFRACKQDPAFSAWATKWAVRLCRALGAE